MSKKEFNKKLSDLEKQFGLKRAPARKKTKYIRTDIHALNYTLDGGIQIIRGGHKIEF